MKKKTLLSITGGLSGLFAGIMTVGLAGKPIINNYRPQVDSILGTQSVVFSETGEKRYNSAYDKIDQVIAEAKRVAVKEGREGTAVMKNDNEALPLKKTNKVALIGSGAFAAFPYSAGDLKAGNADAVDLKQALINAGFTLDEVSTVFEQVANRREVIGHNPWTGEETISIEYDYACVASPGDMTNYKVNEMPITAVDAKDGSWRTKVDSNSTAIIVITRGAGESNTYSPTASALNSVGAQTGRPALALQPDELALISEAKALCAKTVVLVNSGNNLELGEISRGGSHEVDAIAYIGTVNDYQIEGVVDVLSGAVNANGHMADTYVYDNLSAPASINIGHREYANKTEITANGDSRYSTPYGVDIPVSSFGAEPSYAANEYIVEAEGIYVGYKYYETRYFDSVANKGFHADSTAGARHSSAGWKYGEEVLYPFGSGMSYIPYEQNIKKVVVGLAEDGITTAEIDVTNNGDRDGLFTAQLYVSVPYTEYDKTNNVEKSAVSFLTAQKVEVAAGQTKTVTVEIPTRYIASWDSKAIEGRGCYILDEGTYYFTAANGSHDATNNVLHAMGKTDADGMDTTTGFTTVANYSDITSRDEVTFRVSNDTQVKNQFENADANYYWDNGVEYMSRKDWSKFVKDYITVGDALDIAAASKKTELTETLMNRVYVLAKGNPNTDTPVTDPVKFSGVPAEAIEDIKNEFWDKLVNQISVDNSVGGIIHGGSRTETIESIDNPIVLQNEGVHGYTTGYSITAEDESTWAAENSSNTFKFNIHSQTLLATSFDSELAREWGELEGESGLWIKRSTLWGTGLTLRRTAFNGRNYEYLSEDPMLANILGREILAGCLVKGTLNGPKHIGANDQEHRRVGISEFMTEQKLREGDLRAFEGALRTEEGGGLAVMVAFNRIGATAAACSRNMNYNVMRGEWGFKGLISTDMCTCTPYFDAASIVMAGINQIADFSSDDFVITKPGTNTWSYLTVETASDDAEFVRQSRENWKYQLYAFANSTVVNTKTVRVTTWYDTAIQAITITSAVLAGLSLVSLCVLQVIPQEKLNFKKKEN